MFDFTKLVTDGYERKARLYPALLLFAPVVANVIVTVPWKTSDFQTIVAIVVGCGGAFLLSQLARDAGKRGEKQLFAMWGGMPSIAIFRHSNGTLDAITKARYHKKLSAAVKEAKGPTVEQEKADPLAADAVYAAWSNYLRVNCRDTKKFPLLFQANVTYGYRRNVWGLRPIGIAFASLSLGFCTLILFYRWRSTGGLDNGVLCSGVFAFFLLLLWIFQFTTEWVRNTAEAYAERLAECAEELGKLGPKQTPKK